MRSGRRMTCQRTKPLPSSSSSSFPPSSFLPWRTQSSAGVGAPGRPHCSSRRPSLVRSQRGCGCCSGTASGTARGPWCGEAVVPGPHRLHRAPRRAAVTQLRSSLPVPPPTSGQPPQGAGRVLRRTPWFRGSAEPTAKCSRSPSRRGAAGGGPQAAVPPSEPPALLPGALPPAVAECPCELLRTAPSSARGDLLRCSFPRTDGAHRPSARRSPQRKSSAGSRPAHLNVLAVFAVSQCWGFARLRCSSGIPVWLCALASPGSSSGSSWLPSRTGLVSPCTVTAPS